jgi:hypothetical protein
MSRIVWFLPALAVLLLAAGLMAFGPHNPAMRTVSIALVMASLVLGRWAQGRAPSPKRGLGQAGAAVMIGVIFLATLAVIVVLPMLQG